MKKNNSLLITILSGAVFCFVCLGMVFLFPGSSKKFNNSNGLLPNIGEIRLGDDAAVGCASEADRQYNCSGTVSNNQCYVPTNMPENTCKSTSGMEWVNLGSGYACYNVTPVSYTCTACSAGAYLSGGFCYACTIGYYCTNNERIPCSDGESSTGGTSSTSPAACSVCLTGYISNADTGHACKPCSSTETPGGGPGKTSNADHTACVEAETTCEAGKYKNDLEPDGTGCSKCPDGYTSDAGKAFANTDCYVNVERGKRVASAHAKPSPCADGTYNDEDNTKVYYGDTSTCKVCNGDNMTADEAHISCTCAAGAYRDGVACMVCPAGKYCTGGDAIPENCPAGKGKKEGAKAESECEACDNGYYSEAGKACDKCKLGELPTADKTQCKPYGDECCVLNSTGSWTTIANHDGCLQAQNANQTVIAGACSQTENPKPTKMTASQTTVYVSPSETTSGQGWGRVIYVVYDQANQVYNMAGKQLSFNHQEFVGRQECNANGCTVYYKGLGCDQPNRSVIASFTENGGTATAAAVGVISSRYKDWSQKDWNEKNPDNYPLLNNAYLTDSCYAVSGYNETNQTYRYIHNRCCGQPDCPPGHNCSPNTPNNPTPGNPTPSGDVPYCYVDSDGKYHWTDKPQSGWRKVEGISKEADCKENEDPACYIDPNGVYKWGKYAKQDGYTLVPSITDSNLCHNPEPNEACYTDGQGHYSWATTAPEGYTLVEGVTSPTDCDKEETPACYVHGDKYEWGKFDKVMGYIRIDGITSEAECHRPNTEACYVGPDGKYVWGEYGSDSRYTLVPSVTEISKCNNDVPTPATGITLSKVIYIFMAILMAFGVGFIYYSSTAKKTN